MDRVLALRDIHNFRDYGGYRVSGGGRLRSGMLFRSAQHLGGSAEDLATVAGLDLATVVDLRSVSERLAAPCPRGAGFAAKVVAIGDGSSDGAPHLKVSGDIRTPQQARATILKAYRAMPFSRSLIEGFRMYFETLASASAPHLVHCMAGKDRTGLAVALMHDIVGVHPDDRMADYMLTNEAGDPEARIAAGARAVRAVFGSLGDAGVRVLMGVEPAFLLTAFAAIDERCGSFDRYRRDILGVDDRLRALLVEHWVA